MNAIFKHSPNAKIVVCGDFNAEPRRSAGRSDMRQC
jgi:endonuclease/exonuclease/phosphatase family metal-dependent hydrolase